MSLLDSVIAAALPITPRFVVGRVARRYIAGETVEEALETVARLNAAGAAATVDVLGEFIHDVSEAEQAARQYVAVLDAIAKRGVNSTVSIKLTALGLLLDEDVCTTLVRGIAQRAEQHGSFVRVDMEDSPCTESTLALVRTLHGEGRPVGAVIQSYLHRTAGDARALAAEGIPVRICKGIYREPPEIAYQKREEIRDSYRRSLRALLEGGAPAGIATHDKVLVADAERMLEELGVPRERYEFQMLLGVRPWLRDQLIGKGHPMRVYVPFGAAWYGYSVRRLRENPAIAGHVFKAMLGFR